MKKITTLLFILAVPGLAHAASDAPGQQLRCTANGRVVYEGTGKISMPKKGGVKVKTDNGDEHLFKNADECVVKFSKAGE